MMPNGTQWATWRAWLRLCWKLYRHGRLVAHVKNDATGYERVTIDVSP